jgi:hypothetical protein
MRQSLVAVALCLASCGDDLAALRDGGASGADADAALPDAAVDAAADAALAGCDEPVEAVIGPDGGELTLCGARLAVAPGLLAEPIRFAIATEDAPLPDAPRELAGFAFRFTADGAVELPAPVEIAVPHGGRAGRIELFAVEAGELFGVEACTVDDRVIGQHVALLGTFVATVDPYPYADSPADLGSGTLSAMIGERAVSLSFPDDGYLIDQAWGEPIALAAVSDLTEGPEGAEQLRFDALLSAEEATLQFAQWYAGGVIWQLGTPEAPGTTGVLEIESRDGDRLIGTLSASLFAGEEVMALTAEFDLTPAYWTFPPERFCPGGEKPPG